jgi:hypothetical protein
VTNKKEIPARVLLEQFRRTRRILDDLEWVTPRLNLASDRKELWKFRNSLIKILSGDLELKKGIF